MVTHIPRFVGLVSKEARNAVRSIRIDFYDAELVFWAS
jgi:hypothetical protein